MGLFGPSRAEIWQQFSDTIGASFSAGGFFGTDRVDARVDEWIVTLDSIVLNKTTYTRLRAPFRNPSGLRFSVHNAGIFSGIGAMIGMQDIVIGDPYFDQKFVVTGSDELKVTELIQSSEIRQMIEIQPEVHFDIRDTDGWFGEKFPGDTDELHFLAFGTIKDIARLEALFNLFAAILHRLTEIGAASAGDAGVTL